MCSSPFTDVGQIWQETVDPRSMLTRQISFESIYCITFQERKSAILTFVGPCTQPLLPMRAKFGVLESRCGYRGT